MQSYDKSSVSDLDNNIKIMKFFCFFMFYKYLFYNYLACSEFFKNTFHCLFCVVIAGIEPIPGNYFINFDNNYKLEGHQKHSSMYHFRDSTEKTVSPMPES